MESWDEIKTAYHVARIGTVSGAAEALGVHHATVIRHVDSIEARLGVKLFQICFYSCICCYFVCKQLQISF